MSDQLSSDLASLKIDRNPARPTSGGGALRPLIWLVLLGAAGYAGYVQGMPYVQATLFKTEVTLTEISQFSPAQAAIELTSTGYVEPQVVTRVGAKLPGKVASVHVREGQKVKAGDLLIELEHADQEAAIESARMRAAAAQARVATARASLAETQLQAKRQRQLAQSGVAPSANADDLEARAVSLEHGAKAAEAEVKASDAEVNALRVNMRYMKLVAPIDGTITSKPPEIGELLGADIPGLGDQSIQIADFATLMVECDIPEARLHMVKVGAPAEITLDAFPGRRYRGESVEVSPRVNRSKATVGVKVKFVDAAEGVLPDMSARVSFLTQALDEKALSAKAKTVVPASALAERGGAKVVFVLEGDSVRMRTVTLGEKTGNGYELLDGPLPGARVVAEPPLTLADGHKIKEKS